MTIEEIKTHFGADKQVYKFNGLLADLSALQEEHHFNMNYVIVADVIYFVGDKSVDDSRIELI